MTEPTNERASSSDPAGVPRSQGTKYELLAQRLATQLSEALGAATETCLHNIRLPGRATPNEIDVLWIGTLNGVRQRILIECKNHGRTIEQGRVHAFRSVVADIAEDGIPTTGVFVTPKGYQRGGKRIAETYDLVLLELREPTDADLAGRIVRLDINIEMRTVAFNDVHFEWVREPSDVYWPPFLADMAFIAAPDGGERIPAQLLLAGQLGQTIDEQLEAAEDAPVCTVEFGRPHDVIIDGAVVGTAQSISATPTQSTTHASTSVGPGREGIAHLVKDTLGGQMAWFTKDGAVRVIGPDCQPPPAD